jgi:hypothetical protein
MSVNTCSIFRGETHGEHNGLRVGGIKTRFGDCQKRIQRLQVTNKPVERPRSTTPINVVNFEEYKPEKSPSLNSEKLSIKLPPEEFRKRHKSPLRHHGDIFTFVNEDQLFTRTKSSVVETAIKPGQSPKQSFSLFKEGDFSGLYSSKFTTFMGVVLRGLSTGLFVT